MADLNLDNPVWASLTSRHREFAVGDDRARRYRSSVNKFAAIAEPCSASMEGLISLVDPGQETYLASVAPLEIPKSIDILAQDVVVQMVWRSGSDQSEIDPEIKPLGKSDSADMVELAALTRPGPFLSETYLLGSFFGIRRGGKLIAMAGERFTFPGFTEISGVCTHPDFEGLGMARRLSQHVANNIRSRGDRPFLHSWRSNERAIRLYANLGFEYRADVQVTIVGRTS